MERPDPESVAELLAAVHKTSDDMDRREASGWIVAVLDLEPPISVVHAYGPWPEPEQALGAAGRMAADAARLNDPGKPGWEHVVIPLFPDTSEAPS